MYYYQKIDELNKCKRCKLVYKKELSECPHCSDLSDLQVKALIKAKQLEPPFFDKQMKLIFIAALIFFIIILFI